MAIRTKATEGPEDFSPGRLFLDDIEDIVKVLRELVESEGLSEKDATTRVLFSVGDKECDDLEDLRKIGKRFHPLDITVKRGSPDISLHIGPWSSTHWTTYYVFPEEKRWAAYHKLVAIFQRRQLRWSRIQYTTIVYRRSYDPSPIWSYLKEKIIPIVVGLVLGIIGTYLKHKYWP